MGGRGATLHPEPVPDELGWLLTDLGWRQALLGQLVDLLLHVVRRQLQPLRVQKAAAAALRTRARSPPPRGLPSPCTWPWPRDRRGGSAPLHLPPSRPAPRVLLLTVGTLRRYGRADWDRPFLGKETTGRGRSEAARLGLRGQLHPATPRPALALSPRSARPFQPRDPPDHANSPGSVHATHDGGGWKAKKKTSVETPQEATRPAGSDVTRTPGPRRAG